MEGGREGGKKEGKKGGRKKEMEGGKGFSVILVIHTKSPDLLCLGQVTGSCM